MASRLLIAASFAASFLAAQSTEPAKRSNVEGRVLTQTGEGVRGATLRLLGNEGYSQTSDNDGGFLFQNVAPGRYTLSAEKAGFLTQRYGARSSTGPATPLALEAGKGLKDLVITLAQQGVITGRVVDQDGDPVVKLRVQANRMQYMGGSRNLGPGASAITDDLGEFRIANLAPDRYYLIADSPSLTNGDHAGKKIAQPAAAITYYPSARNLKSASPVDVTPGAELRGIDIQLRREPAYSIRGMLLDAAGNPSGGSVFVVSPDDTSYAAASALPRTFVRLRGTPEDGKFEIRNLLAGNYVLYATSSGFSRIDGPGFSITNSVIGQAPQVTAVGRLEVTVAASDLDDLVMPLQLGANISGTVTIEGTPDAAFGQLRVGLREAAEGVTIGTIDPENVDKNGAFLLRGASPAKYFLDLQRPPAGVYLKSVRFGGKDVTHGLVDLTAGSSGSLEILLSSKTAEITGKVLNNDGAPVPGITLTLWPKVPNVASSTGGARTVSSDQTGIFKFGSVAPGDYYVAAWEEIEQGLGQSHDFLVHFTGDASSITLEESASQSVDLKLIPRDRIAAEIAKLP